MVKSYLYLSQQGFLERTEKIQDGEGILRVEKVALVVIVDRDAPETLILWACRCLSYPVVAGGQWKLWPDGNDTDWQVWRTYFCWLSSCHNCITSLPGGY